MILVNDCRSHSDFSFIKAMSEEGMREDVWPSFLSRIIICTPLLSLLCKTRFCLLLYCLSFVADEANVTSFPGVIFVVTVTLLFVVVYKLFFWFPRQSFNQYNHHYFRTYSKWPTVISTEKFAKRGRNMFNSIIESV